jgi:excinuclease UvrABC nuclease subunit
MSTIKKLSRGENSDVQVIFKWRSMDIENPPQCSGIYAVTNTEQSLWYYIGKSQNIARRIVAENHPIQVTKNTSIDLHYLYLRIDKQHISWAENYLIKEHDPEWNGSTSFDKACITLWMCCDLPLGGSEDMRHLLLNAIG